MNKPCGALVVAACLCFTTLAWARGDLESLRVSAGANRTNDCMAQLMATVQSGSFAEGTSAQETLERLRAQADLAQKELKDTWISAAEAALAKNASTFAVLPVESALSEMGYLAALREKGYEVDVPR
jgi:hypothetical protein